MQKLQKSQIINEYLRNDNLYRKIQSKLEMQKIEENVLQYQNEMQEQEENSFDSDSSGSQSSQGSEDSQHEEIHQQINSKIDHMDVIRNLADKKYQSSYLSLRKLPPYVPVSDKNQKFAYKIKRQENEKILKKTLDLYFYINRKSLICENEIKNIAQKHKKKLKEQKSPRFIPKVLQKYKVDKNLDFFSSPAKNSSPSKKNRTQFFDRCSVSPLKNLGNGQSFDLKMPGIPRISKQFTQELENEILEDKEKCPEKRKKQELIKKLNAINSSASQEQYYLNDVQKFNEVYMYKLKQKQMKQIVQNKKYVQKDSVFINNINNSNNNNRNASPDSFGQQSPYFSRNRQQINYDNNNDLSQDNSNHFSYNNVLKNQYNTKSQQQQSQKQQQCIQKQQDPYLFEEIGSHKKMPSLQNIQSCEILSKTPRIQIQTQNSPLKKARKYASNQKQRMNSESNLQQQHNNKFMNQSSHVNISNIHRNSPDKDLVNPRDRYLIKQEFQQQTKQSNPKYKNFPQLRNSVIINRSNNNNSNLNVSSLNNLTSTSILSQSKKKILTLKVKKSIDLNLKNLNNENNKEDFPLQSLNDISNFECGSQFNEGISPIKKKGSIEVMSPLKNRGKIQKKGSVILQNIYDQNQFLKKQKNDTKKFLSKQNNIIQKIQEGCQAFSNGSAQIDMDISNNLESTKKKLDKYSHFLYLNEKHLVIPNQ